MQPFVLVLVCSCLVIKASFDHSLLKNDVIAGSRYLCSRQVHQRIHLHPFHSQSLAPCYFLTPLHFAQSHQKETWIQSSLHYDSNCYFYYFEQFHSALLPSYCHSTRSVSHHIFTAQVSVQL